MKLYTKKGDKGLTGLIGGTRVPKDHIRIEAYGTVDELNSHVGVLRCQVEHAPIVKVLERIQEDLFTVGSQLAADPETNKMELPNVTEEDIKLLENEIDAIDAALPPMKNFILPGGGTAAAQAHIARTVCRRAERRVKTISDVSPLPDQILPYLNRLSDYFFALARDLTVKNGFEDLPWKPRENK